MNSNFIPSIKNHIDIKNKDSWVHRWEPRTKIISCIIMIFGLVALKSPKLLIIAYLILCVILLSMGFTIKELIKRNMLVLPFLLLMVIPLLFGAGYPPSEDRIVLVLQLSFKSLNGLYLMFMMFSGQPITDLLNGLASMRLPSSFISIVFLSWRYIFLLGEKFSMLFKALLSRLFRPSVKKDSLKVYGQVMGGMLIKSIDTSDKVYKAMSSRGFNGTMPTSEPREIQSLDIIKSTTMVLAVILLNIIEKWWY